MADLVGRRTELAALRDALTSATTTGTAAAILVEGDAGIGKTHLLRCLTTEAAAQGARVVRTGITEAESAVSWAGLSVLLDRLGDDDLDTLEPAQRRLLDRARGRTTEGSVDPDDVAGTVATLVARLAAAAPLLLVVDDLHWLDRASATALTVAIRANVHRPIAVIGARRLGQPIAIDIDRIDGLPLRRVRLTGLSVSGVYELLAEHGFTDLRRPDVIRIHELSQGNPLFAVELARLHREGRRITDIDEHDGMRGIGIARLDRLSPAAIDAARVCALLARSTVSEVRAVIGPAADDALIELEREGVISCHDDRLHFTHPLRREGALAGVGTLERRRYHQRIADAIDDPEQAVVHRGEATDAPDAELAAALERIADDAAAQGAPEVALARYRRAEALTPAADTTDRWRRSHRAVRCTIAMGDDALVLDEAMRLFDTAPPNDLLDAALDVLEAMHRARDLEAAAAWAPIGRARFADAPADEVALLERVVRMAQLRDVPAAAALAREALELALRSGDQGVIDRARILALSTALLAGEPVELAAVPSLDLAHRAPGMDATMFLAELLVWTNQRERAEQVLRPMEPAARASGRGAQLVRVVGQLGDLHLRCGDWDAAAVELAEAIEIGDLIGYDVGSRTDLAWLEAARGRDAVARELTDVAGRQLADAPDVHRMQLWARRGFVHLTAERWDAAAADLTRAQEMADAVGFTAVTVLPITPDLVEALVRVGDLDRARSAADTYARAADRAESTFDRALAARTGALVANASGDTDEAVRLAFEAIELHGASRPAPFEEARTRLVAGTVLRRAGRKRDARVQVEASQATFEALGARAFSRRAQAELDRLRTRQAPAGLSPTEQRVAELAGAGRTNGEIANELSITVRTVESNLTRVYRKLGVRSRTELATRIPTPR
jgi:DNA-binding NarL/FixJ family response regulator